MGSKTEDKAPDKTPDYISKHKKLYQHAKKLTDTAGHTHTEAYTAAVNKHLMDGGEVDFERLDDSRIQEQFVKTMSDMYISKAKAHFNISKDLDDLEKEILMQAYSGVTRQQLQQAVGRYGKRFTHQQFEGLKNRIQNAIGERLYASAGGHLMDEHVGGIIKHLGLESKVESSKINAEEARQLLEVFHREGSVPDTALTEILENYKLKKKIKIK